MSAARGAATVREAAFEVLRRQGLTTIFSNPGSTEIPFLAALPDDFCFVLGLHEASVVGMATGWAIGRNEPAFVLLHTTAGLGNAVAALATSRANRAPLVVLVGQQDRRHLPLEPFLAGHLEGLAGHYPVSTETPARSQDVPGAIARARHSAVAEGGPAIVIVPMDDWLSPAGEGHEVVAAQRVLRSRAADPALMAEVAAWLSRARSPVMVVGAGAASADAWSASVRLAEHIGCPVWQEAFGAQAGFPQDHPLFAGHLPANRSALRAALDAHDLVLALGAPVFRQYPYEEGALLQNATRCVLITDDLSEARRSPVDLAVVASPASACAELFELVSGCSSASARATFRSRVQEPPGEDSPLRAGHVLFELGERLPSSTILVEEVPSNRAELHERLPAREPLGFLSAAMGGLGFGLPAAIGLRMALPDRPVVAVIGDGSSLYSIQALWSAVEYRSGVLVVVLANGGYAIMDRLVAQAGGTPPWPRLARLDIAAIASGFGCRARRITTRQELVHTLDEVIPTLSIDCEPLLLEAVVSPDALPSNGVRSRKRQTVVASGQV
jgi:benzoylformate decarboxylase